MSRLSVLKTYKIFINGQFPRTESGRYYALTDKKKRTIANVCLSSRKDFKNAVVAARNAFNGWNTRAAFNRGQILYRIAEMMEGRKAQLEEEIVLQGGTSSTAKKETEKAIDRVVYFAGWCDKYQTLISTVNPVAGPFYNFSVPEPMGVVSIIAPEESGLLGLLSVIIPVIAGGNTCVALASEKNPLNAVTVSEILATSDLPAGVVNILTGTSEELHSHFSSHMDVNATIYCRKVKAELKTMQENSALNLKRFFHWQKDWSKEENQNPYMILDLQEIKTTWHPIENIGVSGTKY